MYVFTMRNILAANLVFSGGDGQVPAKKPTIRESGEQSVLKHDFAAMRYHCIVFRQL
jgi:hypothetical protein